jgi:deferrochelatase/peroxidase EfeB
MKRRAFLAGLAAGTLGPAAGCTADRRPSQTGIIAGHTPETSSAPGPHQPGVTTAPPPAAVLAALDLRVERRDQVARLFRLLTTRIRLLHLGAPGVSVTVAVGAELFRQRPSFAQLRPARLTAMPSSPNDALDPRWCHGDLLLQVCAQRPDAARAALQELLRGTDAMARPRWSITGFRPENHLTPTGLATTRNLFGFREGAGNPDPRDQALMEQLVWVQPDSGEASWTTGGSYQVIRLIRFAIQLWDAEPVEHQEDVFGRHKQTGAPLAASREDQAPNFAVDPDGRITPLDAHIRRANPRTPETEANRILRRSYSYRRGKDSAGRPDEGLIFICFQQDLERGFATIQRRLRGEALDKYVLPFGGGYFFVLPAAPPGGYLGEQLLDAAD